MSDWSQGFFLGALLVYAAIMTGLWFAAVYRRD